MGHTIFWNIPMFLPTQIKLYQTTESPANNFNSDRFGMNHLFLEAKAPLVDFVGELMDGVGLEVSALGAWALLCQNKLERGPSFQQKDYQATAKKGDVINVNENPRDFMQNLIKKPFYRFFALLSNFQPGNRTLNKQISAFMQANPLAAGGEVLLWPKWDPEKPKQTLASMFDASVPALGPAPLVPPTLEDAHPIVAKQMRNVFTSSAKFVLYAVNMYDRKKLEDEANSSSGSLATTLSEMMEAQAEADKRVVEERQRQLLIQQKMDEEMEKATIAAEAAASEKRKAAAAATLAAEKAKADAEALEKEKVVEAALAAATKMTEDAPKTSASPPPPPTDGVGRKREREGGGDDDDEDDDATTSASDIGRSVKSPKITED